MKFHGIDMRGKCYLPEKDHTAEVREERKLIYDPNDEQLYFGSSSQWVRLSSSTASSIPSGTSMWFYEDSAPIGWSPNGTVAGDELLAVRGGSTYTTAVTAAGDFTTPTHSHTISETHNHQWYYYASESNTYSWDSDGSTLIKFNDSHSGKTTVGLMSEITSADSKNEGDDMYTKLNGSSFDTDTDGAVTGYRPRARVGIICTKD
jgi:hypothetical protein